MNAFVKDVMTTNVVWVGQGPGFRHQPQARASGLAILRRSSNRR